MELRAMRPGEREEVLDLLEAAFGVRSLFARYMDTDPLFDPGDVLLAIDGDRPAACVQIFEKQIWLAEREIPLGGIGSVATHPEYRGRGLASRLLARAEDRIRARRMPLGLLFTGIAPFYARLGWIQVPMDLIAIRRDARWKGAPSGIELRAFRDQDLAAVRGLYDRQNERRPGSTRRSESYWRGQIRYAGTPDEAFVVAERKGRILAYARRADLEGLHIMEHACRPDEWPALAALVLSLGPAGGRLLLRSPPAQLETALREAGADIEHRRDPSPMWRVLDGDRLGELAGRHGDEETLIDALIREPRAHFWLSDRF